MTGRYYNYFNVLGEDGLEQNMDLELVMIPRENHNDEDCKRAKLVELDKLEEFDNFKEVNDIGQYRILGTVEEGRRNQS